MLNLQLARKYAMAIFELAQEEKQLEKYGSELHAVSDGIFSNDALKGFITNPQIQPKAKKELLAKLFDGELSNTVQHFLMLLIDKRRAVLLEEIDAAYQKLSNQARGIVIADVTVARPMNDAQAEHLKQKLQAVTERTIQLRMHQDERILGGVIVRMGDRRIDGSVLGRMQALKEQLMANK